MAPIPLDKALYSTIKEEIRDRIKKDGKRWGVYASWELSRRYKKEGGRYRQEEDEEKKTLRWLYEKWIDICRSDPPHRIVPCGRQKKTDPFPVCRPYYRVSSKTPTTWGEMNRDDIQELCRKKRDNPSLRLPSFESKTKTKRSRSHRPSV